MAPVQRKETASPAPAQGSSFKGPSKAPEKPSVQGGKGQPQAQRASGPPAPQRSGAGKTAAVALAAAGTGAVVASQKPDIMRGVKEFFGGFIGSNPAGAQDAQVSQRVNEGSPSTPPQQGTQTQSKGGGQPGSTQGQPDPKQIEAQVQNIVIEKAGTAGAAAVFDYMKNGDQSKFAVGQNKPVTRENAAIQSQIELAKADNLYAKEWNSGTSAQQAARNVVNQYLDGKKELEALPEGQRQEVKEAARRTLYGKYKQRENDEALKVVAAENIEGFDQLAPDAKKVKIAEFVTALGQQGQEDALKQALGQAASKFDSETRAKLMKEVIEGDQGFDKTFGARVAKVAGEQDQGKRDQAINDLRVESWKDASAVSGMGSVYVPDDIKADVQISYLKEIPGKVVGAIKDQIKQATKAEPDEAQLKEVLKLAGIENPDTALKVASGSGGASNSSNNTNNVGGPIGAVLGALNNDLIGKPLSVLSNATPYGWWLGFLGGQNPLANTLTLSMVGGGLLQKVGANKPGLQAIGKLLGAPAYGIRSLFEAGGKSIWNLTLGRKEGWNLVQAHNKDLYELAKRLAPQGTKVTGKNFMGILKQNIAQAQLPLDTIKRINGGWKANNVFNRFAPMIGETYQKMPGPKKVKVIATIAVVAMAAFGIKQVLDEKPASTEPGKQPEPQT